MSVRSKPPQYINERFLTLSICESFFRKLEIRVPKSDAIYINHLTRLAVVFSVVYGDDVYVFCCKVKVPTVRHGGEIEIEITSETEMSHFNDELPSRLPMKNKDLCGIQIFLHHKPDFCSGDKRKVDVIELNPSLFVVMFDSTLYFFQLTHSRIQCLWLSLSELNDDDYSSRVDFNFNSFRCFRIVKESDDSTELELWSDVFNRGNSFLKVFLSIEFNSEGLNRRVVCSRTLITHNDDIGGKFSTTYDAEPHENPATDVRLKIKSEDDDSDEEDEDEDDEDDEDKNKILVVDNDGANIYVFKMLDDDYFFFYIIFRNGCVSLLKVGHHDSDLGNLNSTDLDELIDRFRIDSVDLSEKLEGFVEVYFSCRIVIKYPIKIKCNFVDRFGRIRTEQLSIDPDDELFC